MADFTFQCCVVAVADGDTIAVLAPDENCAAADCAKTVDAGLAQLSAGLAWQALPAVREGAAAH